MRDVAGTFVAQRRAASSQYPLIDALGSTVGLTDPTGTVSARYIYRDPYGEQVDTTGTASTPYRYAGGYLDTETGLTQFGERYYQPTLGRWTQKDPINQAYDPQQANAYIYVGGNPVNLVDPTGACITRWLCRHKHKITGVALGAAGVVSATAGIAGTVGCVAATIEIAGPESYHCAYIGLHLGAAGAGLVAAGATEYAR